MFENVLKFFKKLVKTEKNETNSKDTAKERLHLVLMQDRANVSADFLELMKQEIIEVIKKYIEVEESAIDVRLTNEVKEDGTTGAPSLYANIPILNIKNEAKKEINEQKKFDAKKASEKEEKVEKKENDNPENKDDDEKAENENKKSEDDDKQIKNEDNKENKADKKVQNKEEPVHTEKKDETKSE